MPEDAKDEMSLAVFDPIKACTEEVQKKDAALEIDHTTPDGEKELRVWVKTVKGYLIALEKIRVKAKADSLEYGRAVDKKAKELKAPFSTIITERMKPLDDIEAAKHKAAEAIVEAEQAAKVKADADAAADLKRREAKVAEGEAKIKAAEDAANAETAKTEQAEREKCIAADAAENARKETEAKAKAEADEKERVRLHAEAAAKRKRQQAEEAERKRIADRSHRSKIHAEIEQVLREYVIDEQANDITQALINENIPHVTINY